jgi:putative transposase
MPEIHRAAPEMASLPDGSSAGELIPELARHGLQQLIELELAALYAVIMEACIGGVSTRR